MDDLGARVVRIVKERIAGRNRDIERLGAGGCQVEIVIDELTPRVDHGGHQAVADDVLIALIGDRVADFAGAGPGRIADDGRGDAVVVGSRTDAEQRDVGAAPRRIGDIVAGAVDAADIGRHDAAILEFFEERPPLGAAGFGRHLATGMQARHDVSLREKRPARTADATLDGRGSRPPPRTAKRGLGRISSPIWTRERTEWNAQFDRRSRAARTGGAS
jgi:hypothetical protein